MFLNKGMFSNQSSSNFAHVDQVAPLEMAVLHVNTWIRLRVSAESSWSLFLFDYRKVVPDRLLRCVSWSGSFTFYVCHVAHFHLTPANRYFRLVIINFTDKIWLISINIGSYLCKMMNFDISSAES